MKLLSALGLATLGVVTVLAVAVFGFDRSSPSAAFEPARTVSSTGDVSGPCDEAENANDPRCTGQTISSTPSTLVPVAGTGVDISGPCDEAEHANDPRCTGAAVPGDNSGPGNGDDDGDDDNSGPGNGDDDGDDDNSGPGNGDDDGDDDNSGPGNGDDDGDDDNSGPGNGDDDGDDDNSGPGNGDD